MKKLFFALVMLMRFGMIYADDGVLIVNTTDGQAFRYLFNEQPKIVPDEQNITVYCSGHDDLVLSFSEVDKISFVDDVTMIDSTPSASPVICVKDGTVTVKGTNAPVRVYTILGQMVGIYPAGTSTISMAHHTTYIISVGTRSFKIISK